jgi:hypothetical protein
MDKSYFIKWIRETIRTIEKQKEDDECLQSYNRGCIDILKSMKKFLQESNDYDIN